MRLIRYLLGLAMLATLLVAGFLTMRGLGYWETSDLAQVKELPDGDQEIA